MLYYKTKLECMFESHILIMEWRRGKQKTALVFFWINLLKSFK